MRDETWIAVDTETNGLMSPIYVVEIAAQKMCGWKRSGEAFRALLNHDVPIDPAAEAMHGYSREFLRHSGSDPRKAHQSFHEYASDLPLVAYNLSFDWDRTLLPEYARLGVPTTGRKGFCAMTLARRTISEAPNYKLETLKEHFRLNAERSHRGRNDVVTLCTLLDQVVGPRLTKAGVNGFDTVTEFSRRTPVAKCLEMVCNCEPVWHYVDENNQSQGPVTLHQLKSLAAARPLYVWRDGMPDWVLCTDLPEFVEKPKLTRRKKRSPEAPIESHPPADDRHYKLHYSRWVDEVLGLCRGILADDIVNEREVIKLQQWLTECPCTHLYPINVIADKVEQIVCDGTITSDELDDMKQCLENLLPVAGW